MMIVIEGPDATGKSTLASALADVFFLPVVHSEGPEKHPGEINERIRRYNSQQTQDVIYDRHPCVSQEIYRGFNSSTRVDPVLLDDFYGSRPLFIYARNQHIGGHIHKDHDTVEHLIAISENNLEIILAYQLWAINEAHIIYRIGDPIGPIIAYIKSWRNHRRVDLQPAG